MGDWQVVNLLAQVVTIAYRYTNMPVFDSFYTSHNTGHHRLQLRYNQRYRARVNLRRVHTIPYLFYCNVQYYCTVRIDTVMLKIILYNRYVAARPT